MFNICDGLNISTLDPRGLTVTGGLPYFGGPGNNYVTHSIAEAVYMSTRVLVMSARPGRIVAQFDVPFGFPRHQDLRFEPDFARLSGEISHQLRGAHA